MKITPKLMVIKSSNWSAKELFHHPEHIVFFRSAILSKNIKVFLIGEGSYYIRLKLNNITIVDLPTKKLHVLDWLLIFLLMLFIKPNVIVVLGLANHVPALIARLFIRRAKYHMFVIGEFEWQYSASKTLGRLINLISVSLFSSLFRLFGDRLNGIYAISNYIKRCLIKINNRATKRAIVYYFSVPFEVPSIEICYERARSAVFKVLTIAGIEFRKGLHEVIGTVAILDKILGKKNRVQFIVKGNIRDQRYWYELCKLLKRLDISNVKIITTFLNYEDLITLYRSSHVFLFPTYADSLGLVVLEALSQRLPVIAYRTGGVVDMVFDDINGYLVKPGSMVNLAKLIIELTMNKEKYISLCIGASKSFSYYRQRKIPFENVVENIFSEI